MYPDPRSMTDHELVTMAMVADLLVNYTDEYSDEQRALFAEMDRRYPDASERTAEQVTGNRMTSWEAVTWALTQWTSVRKIVEGPGCIVCGYITGHWRFCSQRAPLVLPAGTIVLVDGAARATVRADDVDGILVRIHEDNTSHWVRRERVTLAESAGSEGGV